MLTENQSTMDEFEVSLRKMNCELNVLSRPDGSAIYSQGETVAIVGVYGPVECKIKNSDIYKVFVEVCFGTKSNQSAVRERYRETIIKQTCENAIHVNLHPRDAISISVQEMENDGSLMAVTLNACCLALINSGLSMKYLFAAVQCIIKESGEIIIDPTLKESEDAVTKMMFVFDSINKNIVTSNTEGAFTFQQYNECLVSCRRASENIFLYYREIVKKYMNVQ